MHIHLGEIKKHHDLEYLNLFLQSIILILTIFFPMLRFDPPGNIRKPLVSFVGIFPIFSLDFKQFSIVFYSLQISSFPAQILTIVSDRKALKSQDVINQLLYLT